MNLSIHPRNWAKEDRVAFGMSADGKKQNTCKPEGKPAPKGIRRRRAALDCRMAQYKGMSIKSQSASKQPGSMRG